MHICVLSHTAFCSHFSPMKLVTPRPNEPIDKRNFPAKQHPPKKINETDIFCTTALFVRNCHTSKRFLELLHHTSKRTFLCIRTVRTPSHCETAVSLCTCHLKRYSSLWVINQSATVIRETDYLPTVATPRYFSTDVFQRHIFKNKSKDRPAAEELLCHSK